MFSGCGGFYVDYFRFFDINFRILFGIVVAETFWDRSSVTNNLLLISLGDRVEANVNTNASLEDQITPACVTSPFPIACFSCRAESV